MAERTTQAHGALLPSLIARALAQAGVAIDALEAIAVSIGPGSFTGLRVGVGVAKGMAFAGGLRVASVPTLEALAAVAEAPPGALVCAALDARKREVYAAEFEATGGTPRRRTADEVLSPQALAERLRDGTVLVGDAAEVYPEALGGRAGLRPFSTHHPRGGVVARLGAARLRGGEAADLATLEPVYVRLPEAERARRDGLR